MEDHTNSRRAFDESHRSFSLAKQPTTHQVHDLCSKFAQMMADDFEGRVAVKLPEGMKLGLVLCRNLSKRAGIYGFGGLARSISARSQSKPWARTLAICASVSLTLK